MAQVVATERELYRDVWNSLSNYGVMSPGAMWAPTFAKLAGIGGTVLDAGVGSGKGALALESLGYRVRACDLTNEGLDDAAKHLRFDEAVLWQDLRRALGGFVDWVYCCDVMEHLPTEFTMLAVSRMLEIARHGVFLSITFHPDHFGQILGKQLHQTVQPFTWWRDNLRELGDLLEARDCLVSGCFLVRPRR